MMCQARAVFAVFLFTASIALRVSGMEAGSNKNDCPPESETYCQNGGTCFALNVGADGFLAKGCICTKEYTGRRCQYKQTPLDILFGPDSDLNLKINDLVELADHYHHEHHGHRDRGFF